MTGEQAGSDVLRRNSIADAMRRGGQRPNSATALHSRLRTGSGRSAASNRPRTESPIGWSNSV
jgi:hypothetical protein